MSPAGLLLAATALLPIRHFTSADGLPQDHVGRTALDAEGFLWIATTAGLGRFDGERFTTFGEADGLPGRLVNDVVIAPDGTHWVATERGLFWFRPYDTASNGRLFRPLALPGVPDDEPYRLLADRAGTVWVGTLRRLWRITADGTGWSVAPFELFPDRPGTRARVQCLREDPAGAVWVGTHNHGLFRIGKDGRLDHRSTDLPESFFVRDLYFGEDGSVWTAFLGGVAVFDGPPFPGEPVAVFGKEKGLSIDTASLLAGRDGSVLVATTTGITEIRRGPAGGWSVGPTLDRRSGLPGDMVSWLLRDPQGNLWVSLMMRGLAKIPRSSFSRLAEAEEPGTAIVDLTRDRDGRVVALASRGATSLSALRVGGEPAGWFPLSLPSSMGYVGWAGHQKILCDSRGTWWIAVGGGVLRYDDPRRLGPARMAHPPDAVFSIPQGLPGGDAFTVGEDTHGDVWMSVQPEREGVSSVSRWIRATGRIETFSIAATGTRSLVGAFQPLRDGSMWIEFLDGRLVRHRQGRFQPIPVDARPEDQLGGLYADAAGRLWRSGRAVFACDHPEADEPRFTRRDIATGAWILSMTEDTHGRMWLGTNQGLLRHDPATGTTRRFTAEDGLPGNIIGLCARDDAGTLWFSDQSGLARLEPGPDPPTPAATARLREVRIAGEPIPLPANGATSLGVITVPPDRRRLAVEFFAVHHGPGAPPRFEYRLEGIDAAWSPPTADRSVQFAHLSPGTYRFLVRAVADDGSTKTPPASIGLHVLAPLWQRAWFLGLVAVTMGAAGYTAYRVRVLRIVAAERIRTRIATDLHDDIGSSLSQIAILSQIAHRQVGAAGTPPPEALQRITSVSGELIDAMSDVVWAISPRWDTLSALVHRMRRFASELFADGAVVLTLELPSGDERPIDPEARRQLYLIFKEALHNVRKHAQAGRVRVELRREPAGGWSLTVEDDGRGFDAVRASEGHGLRSMRRRAEAAGGRLDVRSTPDGTCLVLTLPEKLSNR